MYGAVFCMNQIKKVEDIMKKIIATLLVILSFALCFSACEAPSGNDNTETESETKAELKLEDTDYNADCVKRKGKRLVILLPESNEILPVINSYVKYLSLVSDELVLEAEKKITQEVNEIGGELDWTLELNDEGVLCLRVEVVKTIDDAEGEGCGIDHEHFIFSEPIVVEE